MLLQNITKLTLKPLMGRL